MERLRMQLQLGQQTRKTQEHRCKSTMYPLEELELVTISKKTAAVLLVDSRWRSPKCNNCLHDSRECKVLFAWGFGRKRPVANEVSKEQLKREIIGK